MRLFRVELRRLLSRRAVRVLLALFLVLIVVVVVGNYLNATDEEPLTHRWLHDAGLGFGGGFATLAFVLGATAGGAEWSARTMEALLVWEPRRVRLILTKAAVLAVVMGVAAVVVQVVVTALARWAVAGRGTMAGAPDDFWSTYVGNSVTSVLFAMMTSVFAFAIASLTRNTGFALGAAFVYVIIVERLLMLLPDWVDGLTFFNNAGAFLNHGIELTRSDGSVFVLGTVRAGVTLLAYAGGLLVVAAALFQRRDVT